MTIMEILEQLVEIDKEARLAKITELIGMFTDREFYIQEDVYKTKHYTMETRNIVIPSFNENKLTMTAHWDVSGDEHEELYDEESYKLIQDAMKRINAQDGVKVNTPRKKGTAYNYNYVPKTFRSGGYNDNLSSIAILLKLLQDGKITDDVEICFTDHEECGGDGMVLYTNTHNPKLVYNFDINGVGDTIFWDNNRFSGIPTPENTTELDVIFNDSHISATAGIPSVLIMSGHIDAPSVVGDIFDYQHCGTKDKMEYIVPDQMQKVYELACKLIEDTDVETISQVKRDPMPKFNYGSYYKNSGWSATYKGKKITEMTDDEFDEYLSEKYHNNDSDYSDYGDYDDYGNIYDIDPKDIDIDNNDTYDDGMYEVDLTPEEIKYLMDECGMTIDDIENEFDVSVEKIVNDAETIVE